VLYICENVTKAGKHMLPTVIGNN